MGTWRGQKQEGKREEARERMGLKLPQVQQLGRRLQADGFERGKNPRLRKWRRRC